MPASDQPSEGRTRREQIDPLLTAAGWQIMPADPAAPLPATGAFALTEYLTENGPADYALCLDGQIVAMVEAKRQGLSPQEVLSQAERYSRGLRDGPFNHAGFRTPFLYASNGTLIWCRDVRQPRSLARELAKFHTPDALRDELTRNFDEACGWFPANPIAAGGRIRPYQIEANQAIEGAIADHKRRMLVAMATGTGKTFTMVHQVHRLMKSGVARRVLFLVDRRALAAQAVRAFASFEPERGLKFNQIYEVYSQRFQTGDLDEEPFDPKMLPNGYLTHPQPEHTFVYICTIQRMAVNLFGRDVVSGLGEEPIDEEAGLIDIPVHAFDVIIADECHRGYTAKENAVWRRTLDHFDAIKVGLTATPAAHTTNYFRDVVYRYEYARAVQEGFLVDYDVVKVSSDVRLNGVFLAGGQQVTYVDPASGQQQLDLLEDERQYDATEIERRVTAPESNRLILEEVKRYAEEHEQATGRFPKTLIFAVGDEPHRSHADQLVQLAREAFGRGHAFAEKITGRVDRPLQRIREFRNRPDPHVVVTVDLLTTGVDIPDLEFIVLLRPVKSRILFEQMLGRGTRKGDRFPDKSRFVVFDCFAGTLIEYFRDATAITTDLPETESQTLREIVEAIWDNRDRTYNIRCLVRRLQRIDKQLSGEGRERLAAFIPDGDLSQYAARLPGRLDREFTATMRELRTGAFLDLLTNPPRARDPFVVATEAGDQVTSEWLVRDATGREYKPGDYLLAFAEFVREKEQAVRGIRVLLREPAQWSVKVSDDLRLNLERNPLPFAVDTLQRAHALRYGKRECDLISMVKHAAQEEQPLLNAEERVDRAIARVSDGRQLTPEQRQWLERMRGSLIANLALDRDDFSDLPILADPGGWRTANRTFDGQLAEVVRALNEAVAA